LNAAEHIEQPSIRHADNMDQREAVGQVIAGTAVEPHLGAVLAGDNPETVMLYLVQPSLARWRALGFGREARRNETWGQDTHVVHGRIN
jgi:hypothetical protein